MKRTTGLVALWWLFSGASPSSADIYVWRDSSGISHYTNDLANVPPEYRDTAGTVAKDWVRAQPPPEPPAAPPPAAPVPAPVQPSAAGDEQPLSRVYEAGFEAGLRGSEAVVPSSPASFVVNSNVAPIVQVMTEEPRREVVLPFVFDHRRPRARHRDRDEDRRRAAFPPAEPLPALRGPAGPPPVYFSR